MLSIISITIILLLIFITSSLKDDYENQRRAAEKIKFEKIQEEELIYHSKFVKDFHPLIESIKTFHKYNKCLSKEDLLISDKDRIKMKSNLHSEFSLERIAEYCSTVPSCKNLNLFWESDKNYDWTDIREFKKRGFLSSPDGTKIHANVMAKNGLSRDTLVEISDGCYDINPFKVMLFIKPKKKKNTTVEFWLARDGSILCGEKLRDYNNMEIKLRPCL